MLSFILHLCHHICVSKEIHIYLSTGKQVWRNCTDTPYRCLHIHNDTSCIYFYVSACISLSLNNSVLQMFTHNNNYESTIAFNINVFSCSMWELMRISYNYTSCFLNEGISLSIIQHYVSEVDTTTAANYHHDSVYNNYGFKLSVTDNFIH